MLHIIESDNPRERLKPEQAVCFEAYGINWMGIVIEDCGDIVLLHIQAPEVARDIKGYLERDMLTPVGQEPKIN